MNTGHRVLLVLVLCLSTVLWLCIYSDGIINTRPVQRQALLTYWKAWTNRTSDANDSVPDVPRILLWTPFYKTWSLGLQPRDAIKVPRCKHRCHLTNDRSALAFSDAIVFHTRDLNLNDIPSKRAHGQKWVFWCMEPPPYSFFGGFHFMRTMFNWTMTYRSDSDVPVQYGQYTKKFKEVEKNLEKLWQGKTKTAAWVVSHCRTDSRREDFVRELSKYISVDVYGACGPLSCDHDENNTCFRRIEKEYFFMLALENSLCRDYISEKLFSALQHDIVPVVLGSANYGAVSPPNSVIDASAFASPRELATRLVSVKRDYNLYKRHLEWKSRYDVMRWEETFCALCEKLYSEEFLTKSVYEDMGLWWVHQSRCRRWHM